MEANKGVMMDEFTFEFWCGIWKEDISLDDFITGDMSDYDWNLIKNSAFYDQVFWGIMSQEDANDWLNELHTRIIRYRKQRKNKEIY